LKFVWRRKIADRGRQLKTAICYSHLPAAAMDDAGLDLASFEEWDPMKDTAEQSPRSPVGSRRYTIKLISTSRFVMACNSLLI